MRILVFGATGRCGRFIVEQALDAGHDVTVFVRDPERLSREHSKLKVVQGEFTDSEALRALMKTGFDAVVSAIGPVQLKPSTVVTDSTKAIIAAMQVSGRKRFLMVSVVSEISHKNFIGKLSTWIIKVTPVRHSLNDHAAALVNLKKSDLNWTLAGCPIIKDGPRMGRYRTSLTFNGGFKYIHPPDVANFIMKEITDPKPEFKNTVVGIWY